MEIRSATLCPVRHSENGEEVLLTRRAFWNHQKGRPMRYPGEWIFGGGIWEEGDKDLAETAVREFREELGYKGKICDLKLLRSATQTSVGKTYYIEFYSAKIDADGSFEVPDDGEVIDFQWMTPDEALSLINSDKFTKEQLEEFKTRGLNNQEKYEAYAVTEREIPSGTVQTLKFLQSTYS